MKKIVCFIILTMMSVGLLIGLSQNLVPVKEGIIYEKEYIEPSATMVLQPIINGNSTTYIPTWHKIPEKYLIRIRGTVNGKEKEVLVEINAKEYSKYNIGDFYDTDERE